MAGLTPFISSSLRWLGKSCLESLARVRGMAFLCAALAGKSGLNLCISSDLMVSCSGRDSDGSSVVGNLRDHSLTEILSGPTAEHFRETLARGRLPTPLCGSCHDLHWVSKEDAAERNAQRRLPSFVMVENTSACNLRCTSCPRDRIRRVRRQVSMSLDDIRRVACEIRETGIASVGYLHMGEPFLSRNIGRELEILREESPALDINTSTNGMFLESQEKREAAMLFDRIQISLDGSDQQTASRYQRGIDFHRVYRNMRALVIHRDERAAERPIIVWKHLLFRWNERKDRLRRAIDMAIDAGVDEILFEKTTSPLHGLPWRYYLGLLDGIGQADGWGIRVRLRTRDEHAGVEQECHQS